MLSWKRELHSDAARCGVSLEKDRSIKMRSFVSEWPITAESLVPLSTVHVQLWNFEWSIEIIFAIVRLTSQYLAIFLGSLWKEQFSPTMGNDFCFHITSFSWDGTKQEIVDVTRTGPAQPDEDNLGLDNGSVAWVLVQFHRPCYTSSVASGLHTVQQCRPIKGTILVGGLSVCFVLSFLVSNFGYSYNFDRSVTRTQWRSCSHATSNFSLEARNPLGVKQVSQRSLSKITIDANEMPLGSLGTSLLVSSRLQQSSLTPRVSQ